MIECLIFLSSKLIPSSCSQYMLEAAHYFTILKDWKLGKKGQMLTERNRYLENVIEDWCFDKNSTKYITVLFSF